MLGSEIRFPLEETEKESFEALFFCFFCFVGEADYLSPAGSVLSGSESGMAG